MEHDPSALLTQLGRDVTRYFGYAPSAICQMEQHGWLALSGERGPADFNMCAVSSTGDSSVLERYVRTISENRLNAIVLLDENAPHLSKAALALGLTAAGAAPVMCRDGSPGLARSTRYNVRPVTAMDHKANSALIAEAYSVEPGMVERAVPIAAYAAEVDGWVVERDGEIIGTGAFIRSGDHIGIYSMGTPVRLQRQGIGRAMLETAMTHYLEQGVRTFELVATEAGYRLYEQVGFRTVASPQVFLVGESTQFQEQE